MHTELESKKAKVFDETSTDYKNEQDILVSSGPRYKLDPTLNALLTFENMLQPTTQCYDDVGEEDKKTLLLAIIEYVIVLEVKWDNIKKDIPKIMWDDLMKRRCKAIVFEEKIRNATYNQIGSSLTLDDLESLKKICIEMFRMKGRVNMLMTRNKKLTRKVRKEIAKIIQETTKKYGMLKTRDDATTENVEESVPLEIGNEITLENFDVEVNIGNEVIEQNEGE